VHLSLKFDWQIRPIHDVIARLRGSEFPDEWVIRGNHHDAWVNGADDPISGLSAMLEEARTLGELVRKGWRPKRTILYCAWDGEEPGLLGSTEWAETHAEELSRNAVAYLNSDNNSRGFWRISASQTLQKFFDEVAQSVEDPEAHVSLAKRRFARDVHDAADESFGEGPGRPRAREEKPDLAKVRARNDTPVDPLGSGSDYTVFLDHLGIASADLRFEGEDMGGVYHSIYDDFYWYTHFSDTDFVFGRALAQAGGTSVMRLAGADLLPFEFVDLSEAVSRYVGEIKKHLDRDRARAEEHNRELEEGVFRAVEDPRRPTIIPKAEPVPPELDFAPLERACSALDGAARQFEAAYSGAVAGPGAKGAAEVNRRLLGLERLFLSDGLPGRPWFRNEIYAPGFYTGYGVKTLPAVREALEQKNWRLAAERIPMLAKVLEREADGISQVTRMIR
jgi:N-acetylated-alpha-linked acidic dipeptidase